MVAESEAWLWLRSSIIHVLTVASNLLDVGGADGGASGSGMACGLAQKL